MPYLEAHGGKCCGMHHIHRFDCRTTKTIKEALDDVKKKQEGCTPVLDKADPYEPFYLEVYDLGLETSAGCIALEICLTDSQCEAHDSMLPQGLKKLGFKFTKRWLNANSGNYVNQFVWAKKATKARKWKW